MNSSIEIKVGARCSPLSKAQVKEVLVELVSHHQQITFCPVYIDTCGDLDQKTSLRKMDKTDFFTRELDQMLFDGKIDVAIHSAKDLPDPIKGGIQVIAITKGIDSSDSLVMAPNMTLESLKKGSIVATSSERRENAVRALRGDFRFIDIRGPIEKRLSFIDDGKADAVVVAEAALIRLGLKHVNRIKIPGETAFRQGQLAILARDNDHKMNKIFSPLHY